MLREAAASTVARGIRSEMSRHSATVRASSSPNRRRSRANTTDHFSLTASFSFLCLFAVVAHVICNDDAANTDHDLNHLHALIEMPKSISDTHGATFTQTKQLHEIGRSLLDTAKMFQARRPMSAAHNGFHQSSVPPATFERMKGTTIMSSPWTRAPCPSQPWNLTRPS